AGGGRQGRGQAAGAPAADGSTPPAPAFNAAVFVLRDGAPVRVPIQTGITDGVNTQVVAGLQAGDSVITGAASSGSSGSSSSAGSGGSIFGFGGGGRPPGGRPGG
ncbi:MAG TPA: efflux RND transporter periplasmic adaptor subunit, partial [Chloroflexota bacterium]|nr:efflux RND transporter periplasmic adaptor subunit [Chloroflexota bacterium]